MGKDPIHSDTLNTWHFSAFRPFKYFSKNSYICIHIYIDMHIFVHVHVCMYDLVVKRNLCTHTCMHIYIYIYMIYWCRETFPLKRN